MTYNSQKGNWNTSRRTSFSVNDAGKIRGLCAEELS
jgi:hypothetical protein